VMMESTDVRRWVTHMLCWSCGMYFSAAASSEKDHGRVPLREKNQPPAWSVFQAVPIV